MDRPNKIVFTIPKEDKHNIINFTAYYIQEFEAWNQTAEFIIIHQKWFYEIAYNHRLSMSNFGFLKINPDGSTTIMGKKVIRTCDIDEDTIMII